VSNIAAASLIIGVLLALIGASAASANGVQLEKGDVLASIGEGNINHFNSTGVLKDTLTTGLTGTAGGGMCFDSSGNLYGTEFSDQTMSKFDSGGNLLTASLGSGFNEDPESCVLDASNNLYVGQADGSHQVLKFDSSGSPLGSFSPAPESRGTDWVDLAADQCTLRYTSEGNALKAFDVCTNEQLPDFATELPGPCFEHRILADGSELVACSSKVELLGSNGQFMKAYEPGGTELFALNLDPDRTSFWTADLSSGQIWRIDIASGTVLTTFSSGSTSGATPGLAIVGEITAQPKVELVQPGAASLAGSPFSLTAAVTEAGVPRNGVPVTFTVTGANPQSGSSTTNETGRATFTYSGTNAGTDHIVASFLDRAGKTVISNEVTQTWIPTPPPPTSKPPAKIEVLPFKAPSAPVLGKTVNVEVVSGMVFVKLPAGAHLSLATPSLSVAALSLSAFESLSKGAGFIPLTEARQIPVGSTLDTTGGVARLTTATATRGKVQIGDFGAGIFTILQSRKQRGLTDLNIVNTGNSRQLCATSGKKALAASKHLSSQVVGRLTGSAHGKYTTRGQYSAATVRGTIWSVANRCDGTFTQVSRGVVSVRDFRRRTTITLRAGQHYLAKAP